MATVVKVNKDQLRIYDSAIVNWLKNAPIVTDDKAIEVVFATPDRAFAAMREVLKGVAGPVGAAGVKQIPLPFISIVRGNLDPDLARYQGVRTRMYFKLATSETKEAQYSTLYPLPYDIPYTIEVWARNRSVLNLYTQYVLRHHREGYEGFLKIDFADLWAAWGSKIVPLRNNGIVDNSDLESGEGERVLRFTHSIVLKGWLFEDIDILKSVFKVQTQFSPVEKNVNIKVSGTTVDSNPIMYPISDTWVTTSDGQTKHLSVGNSSFGCSLIVQ